MGKIIDKEEDVIEISLDGNQLDELINKMNELKESKSHLHFDIDKENHFMIHHEEDELL